MKQVMKFNLYGCKVAVYYQEETDSYIIFDMNGKKKIFVDEVEGTIPASEFAINYCYLNACGG